MLQNAYLLAKIGADTAENERIFAKILSKIGNYRTGPLPYGSAVLRDAGRCAAATSATGALLAPSTAPCGKLYRPRSRMYRNEILQVNTRRKALAEINFSNFELCRKC